MIGDYWTTGIMMKYLCDGRWLASLDFLDRGHSRDESTRGMLHTSYYIDPVLAARVLKGAAEKLGITFESNLLFVPGDGEAGGLPDDWREVLKRVANETGMVSQYEVAAE